MPRPQNQQPRRPKPDVIETYPVNTEHQLLPFLIESMPMRKRTVVKNMLRHNQVAVNGKPITLNSTPLNPGDKVEVNLTREFRVFQNRRMKIIYEDDDVIVIEKGYGLLSMASDRKQKDKPEETAYSILREYFKWHSPDNKVFIVHRLDQNTSGLMMLAKNVEAKDTMQHNWNNMVLQRKYIAVVEGYIDDDQGEVRSYLAETSQHEVYSTENPQEGKLAVTRYRVLKRSCGHTMLEVELDTGRKNQIRVHMKDLGHPIAGDRKYGARSTAIHRLALHAQTLRFAHPVTRRDMNFTTPIPGSFYKLVGGK
ncbi:MAG: RluA family pseudouridine synthase [Muribaculum sp.]|nr:RluA family pseudouridine synthase [Muribaculaceae bacterium]MCM1080380.1 RluA family pseudouridine synthase [Muribaculum sp.]